MNKRYPYDCAAIFSRPLNLENKLVYGTLFSKQRELDRIKIPHWKWWCKDYMSAVDEYIKYLGICDKTSEKKDIDYTLVEYDHSIEKEIKSGETEEDWILSEDLIKRLEPS